MSLTFGLDQTEADALGGGGVADGADERRLLEAEASDDPVFGLRKICHRVALALVRVEAHDLGRGRDSFGLVLASDEYQG